VTGAAPDQGLDAGPAAGVRWDLGDLYDGPEDPAIEADLDDALARAERFAERHRGHVAERTAPELAAALDELEAISERVARAGAFAGLSFAWDTSVARHGALLQHVQQRSSAIQNALVFFELEWVATPEDRAAEALASPELAGRRHYLARARRYRPHVLSEPEEQIAEDLANTGTRAWSRLFDEVMSAARFRLGEGDGAREVAEEEVLSRLYDPDRDRRREAALSLTAGLKENERVLAYVFNVLTQDKATRDRLRHYPHAKQSRNLGNEIEDATVEALLSAVERRYSTVQRYYRLKAKLLGVEPLEDFDRYAPIDSDARAIGFDEAREIVIDAYGGFAPRMAEIARLFFERHWVDAELRPGKRGGAFSASTVPSVHPYVLLNYTGHLRDVMTIAHELGHGVHQYLAREQGLFEQDTPLTTAETASVFGEMLVFRRLLSKQTDRRVRLALLCGKLEDAFATVSRQVAMTRFEESLHAARRAEGELPVERIDALWMAANRAMFGDAVHLNDHYASWWLYIPHFVHSPFYCYAYAFGELLVLALLRRYDAEGEAFVPKYLELLRAGGSDSPPALLARLGLDIDDPAFWDGGLQILDEMVSEAETIAAAL